MPKKLYGVFHSIKGKHYNRYDEVTFYHSGWELVDTLLYEDCEKALQVCEQLSENNDGSYIVKSVTVKGE